MSYEFRENEFVDCMVTKDELHEFFSSCEEGNTIFRQRMNDSSGIAHLAVHFQLEFEPKVAKSPKSIPNASLLEFSNL